MVPAALAAALFVSAVGAQPALLLSLIEVRAGASAPSPRRCALDRRTPVCAGVRPLLESCLRTMHARLLPASIIAALLLCAVAGATLVRSARDYAGQPSIELVR
jgi:hypothetical protein